MDVEVVGKFLSTLPEDDDHPYRTGPWRPQTTEFDASARSFPEDWRSTRPAIVPAVTKEAGRRSVDRTAAESVLIPRKKS